MQKASSSTHIHLASAFITFICLTVLYAIPFILGMFGLMPGEHAGAGKHADELPLLYFFLFWAVFPVSAVMSIVAIPLVLLVLRLQKSIRFSWRVPLALAFPLTLGALLLVPAVAVVPLVLVSLITAPSRLSEGILSVVDLAMCALALSLPFMLYWTIFHMKTKDKKGEK